MNEKYICNYCFDNEELSQWIVENGVEISNDYTCSCGVKADEVESQFILEKKELTEKLKEIILELYEHENIHGLVGSARSYAEKGEGLSVYHGCVSLREVCEDLFANEDLVEIIYESVSWKNIADGGYDDFSDVDNSVWKDKCWWGDEEFAVSQWQTFCENVKHKARYFNHKDFSVTDFLDNFQNFFSLLEFSDDLILYRARKITSVKEELEIKSNPSCELGKVPIQYAKSNNRFSPVGISYGYFALDEETAIKEIRAENNNKIAIGKFEITNELKLIDFRKETMKNKINIFNNEFNDSLYCEQQFIKEFLQDISKPISEEDSFLEYIPTQIMAEYIWHLEIDGFLYDSSQNEGGVNLVIFENKYFFKNYEIKEQKKDN